MRSKVQTPIAIFIVASLLIIGSLNLTPFAQADELTPEKVPEPIIREVHEYNVSGHGSQNDTSTYFNNEKWSLSFSHGDVETSLMARNITQYIDNATGVGYSNDIAYRIGDTRIGAQFMIRGLIFKIGDQKIYSMLKTCDEFELIHSPIKYDGTIPTVDCNITYERIRVYQNDYKNSTLDITLFHHFRLDWNQTDMKVEALFDFSNTRLYQMNGTELNAGEPFTAEIEYAMMLANPDKFSTDGPIVPTSVNGTTMEYNLTLDNGSPLTLSKLEMKDSFTIQNGTGAHPSVGYSLMGVSGGVAQVNHGFPNLTYKDTLSIKSDPEITIYHDRVTANSGTTNGTMNLIPIVAIGAIVAVAAMGAVVFMRKRKKNRQVKGEKELKKP